MGISEDRRNAGALPWLRAVAFALVAYLALAGLRFYPDALPPVIALATAAFAVFAPGIAVLVLIVALGVPLVAANALLGALFLVLGFGTIQYLTEGGGRALLVIGLAFVATLVHAEWGVVVLAGYLLGASEGAVAAFVACLVVQAGGLLLGSEAVGSLATGGHGIVAAPVQAAKLAALEGPLTFGWLLPSVKAVRPAELLAYLSSVSNLVLFVVQPFLWATGAAVAGLLRTPAGDPGRPVRGLAAAAAGTGALAVTSVALMTLSGGPVPLPAMLITAAASLAFALGGAALSDWVFTPTAQAKKSPRLSPEDADVDDLLRTISSAEEALASKHTARSTVVITDMKSFSRLTQERGSTETAKIVQRHRDLLLPLVENAGGHGKSTGGDGLLAAFPTPAAALATAVEMQRTLAVYNAGRAGEDAILIRIGVATGEVVLDKGGKPFLGDALNLAARVMSLADGGQVFTTRDVVDEAGFAGAPEASHGEFRLKNIAVPVEIVELLWAPDQLARPPAEPESD